MIKSALKKFKDSFLVVAPISLVIFLLCTFIVPTSASEKINLIICCFMLIVGLALFETGANSSMSVIGETIGSGLCRTKKLWLIVLSSLAIGFIVTFAEPDLQVFASQVANSFSGISNKWIIVSIISLGVAISLLLAVFRIIFKFNYSILMLISYGLVIALSFFVPQNMVGFAFDSGSVTTGPISVPFIISLGFGISTVLWRNKKQEDAFGTIGLCSVGPILACMIFCLFLKGDFNVASSSTVSLGYLELFLKFFKEVAIVILPILIIFLIFQNTMIKYPKKFVLKVLVGLLITYLGVVIFLVGINQSYLPLGFKIGKEIAGINKYLIIPLGFLLGFCSVIAEPALSVLKVQISQITKGKIKPFVIVLCTSLGVSAAVASSSICVLFNVNCIYFLIPIYSLIILLSFLNSKLLNVIAFDAGGVATGAMSVSFILPFISGTCFVLGASSGFGTVALIAAFPILSIQILGLIFKIKTLKVKDTSTSRIKKDQTIVDFDWEEEWAKEKA